MQEQTYLVTGAMGCIGAWMLYHLKQQNQRVVSFDISQDRHRLNLLLSAEEQQGITFVDGDLTDFEQVVTTIREQNVTRVIHLAALQVPFCKADPVQGARVNVVGTVNIFEAARQAGLEHVTFASSIAVYGPADEYPAGPIAATAVRAPRTLYGVYKVANEDTAQVYWQDHHISSIGLRPYTVYGVGRDQGLTSDPTKAMLAAVKGESFKIDFGGTMQFQLASDVAQQFIDAASFANDGAQVFNLGTQPASVAEIIDHIKAVKPAANLAFADKRLPFPESFDDTILRQQVSTIYETPLAAGVQRTIEHFESCLADGRL